MRFLSLNDDVLNFVLGEWISLQGLCRVDTAFCNKIERIAFLELFTRNLVSRDTDWIKFCVPRMFSWFVLRNVKLSCVGMLQDRFTRKRENIWKKALKKIGNFEYPEFNTSKQI